MDDAMTFQQREFLRIRVSLPIEVMVLIRDDEVPDGKWLEGEMTEIGGGGAKIKVPAEVKDADVVAICFVLPDVMNEIKTYARVVSVIRRCGEVCVKFIELPESERNKILRYAFREQIRRYKASLSEDWLGRENES